MSYAVKRPDPKGCCCSCLKRHCLLVSRRIHRYCIQLNSPFAGVRLPYDRKIAAKGRLKTLEAENRQDNKKKNLGKDEWKGEGGPRGPEGGPGRIVIGVTCIRRGPQMTITRRGRCMSLRKVHPPFPQYYFRDKLRRATVYSEGEAHSQRSLTMCRRNGNLLAPLTDVLAKRSCVSCICNRRQYSSSTIRKRFIIT